MHVLIENGGAHPQAAQSADHCKQDCACLRAASTCEVEVGPHLDVVVSL